jgi:ubiquitin-conjugating enzyme E2 variant
MIIILVSILAAWLFADLVAGLFHWFEDRYLDETVTFEIFRGIATDNIQHHAKPTAMTLSTPFENCRSGIVFSIPVGLLFWYLDFPLWFWLGLLFSGFGNLIHRYSHIPYRKRGWFVRFMQWTGLFISEEHHDIHHRYMGKLISKKDSSRVYCPMTNWVNPIVDKVRLWAFLEKVLSILGMKTLDKKVI